MRLFTYKNVLIMGLALIVLIPIFSAKKIVSRHSAVPEILPTVNLSQVYLVKNVNTLSVIGTVKAAQGISVSAPISGIITSIQFQSGRLVKADTVLATLNNQDLRATVLVGKSKYLLAKMYAERLRKLVTKGYVSRQDVDQNLSIAKQAKAQLQHDQALLDNTIIKAPFTGSLGIRQVDIGQYVNAGQEIVSLQDRSVMYVDFSISEKHSDQVAVGNPITLNSQQTNSYQWQGKILAIGSQMDQDTRSVPVRAVLSPPYTHLIPGMYGKVSVLLPKSINKPAVPQTAIVYNPYGDLVYLYKDGVVMQRFIQLGQKIGNSVCIEKGLNIEDKVVVAGQQKLFNGAKVQVVGN